MKNLHLRSVRTLTLFTITAAAWLLCDQRTHSSAAPALTLFEDNFSGGIPGWTAVQPIGGVYIDGPMLWEFDAVTDSFSEQSNLYTDSATFSSSRISSMLINGTVAPVNFTYTARLTAGDDDAFGLIWGFEDEDSFYRVTFARQNRALAGWPYQGVIVDRMNNGQFANLFGPDTTFVNTVGQPFDVTITVSGGQLSLTIVDNPLVAPVTHNLITGLGLPTAPTARVGLFSWGQSGNNPRAFRIQNPVLSPTPLTGDPASTVLANWTFLIPPGGPGTTNALQSPIWAQGLSAAGDRGTMIENSDWTANNIARDTTNFPAPSAIAGNVDWSNYVYSVRFVSNDNDAFGMLLRYKNETNFYRIAFRNQASTAGVKQGISIQKNVDLTFDQIFAATTFIPPTGVPIDVHAFIRTNRLQIVIVANPLGASPSSFFFGPFDIAGGTVDNGKVGIFSWAQYNEPTQTTADAGTEVDSVKVSQVDGEALIVASPFGTPNPAIGISDLTPNSLITATNNDLVVSAPGVRQILVGWSGVGSVPASGTTNNVTFTLSTFSSIIWNWRTEYLLTTSASTGGSVGASTGPWIANGSNVTVTATAAPGFIFTGWLGDSIAVSSTNLTLAMVRPITLTANFAADSDSDGLADDWELQYFGNLSQSGAGDPDADTVSNLNEFLLGTNPNHAEALLVSDGLTSQWINTHRDVALPGQMRVIDFGAGFRGVFDDSNDNRSANDFTFIASTNYADFASFQSPRMVVRSNLWNTSWGSNFSASIEFSVGDDDGNCFYFRYRDERNWYRVTLCGSDPLGAPARPNVGLSVQRRVNGNYANLTAVSSTGPAFAGYTDPTDGLGTPAGFKRVRLTVNATNESFEVRVIGWDVATMDFNANFELINTYTDTSHTNGSIGLGFWGQGAFGGNQNQTNGTPIPFGGFADNISVKAPADGSVVFSENWETVPLTNQFPTGWTNAHAGSAVLEGNWHMSAHGTIAQQSNEGLLSSGTLFAPKGDADGPILLAPNPMATNYYLQIGLHPFDNDGIGFVYDFQDTNNFTRVLFRSEQTFETDVPPGLTVSRRSGGVWTDIVAGDPAFTYTPGRPFEVTFANNNGDFTLVAKDLDNPGTPVKWHWTGPAATPGNRFGIATWLFQDAHVLYARAYSLPTTTPVVPFKITKITVSGGIVTLDVSKPAGSNYHVLRASNVEGPYVTNAANQSAAQYTEPAPPAGAYYRLQLMP
jgi:uncharacterized repeat protein (TIGR02543 family)